MLSSAGGTSGLLYLPNIKTKNPIILMPMHPIPIFCHKTIDFSGFSGKSVKKRY